MIPTNKKLAILHPYLTKKGGAVNMMIYLSNFLKDKNNDVTLYAFSYNKKLFPSNENNFKINYFNNSKILSIFKIAYAIRKSNYIIIGNSPMHFVGVISKLLFRSKAKLIWWHHHYPWYYGQKTNVYIKLKRFFERSIIKNIDSVIVNSKYLQDSIEDIYKVNSKILYPVLDNQFLNYNSENKKPHPQPLPSKEGRKSKVIFTYGRWVEGKNLEMIFQTYNELKEKIPDLILNIGGGGKEVEKFKNKYKSEKNIKFLGFVDKKQIIESLEQSSLFLFPSKVDSFGLVILESMSIGVPVISYNLSGAKEIVKNGYNGFLVNSDSEFIKKTYEILSNSSLRDKLSTGSINTAKTFSEHNFEKQLSKIF